MTEIFNLKNNKHLRRNLRKQEVGAEEKLWWELRRKNLGYRFRRQFGIGKYMVDFYCPKLKLIIEIDGDTHATDSEIKNDDIREKYLKDLGLIVKRYSNSDVYENISEVVNDIYDMCNDLVKN